MNSSIFYLILWDERVHDWDEHGRHDGGDGGRRREPGHRSLKKKLVRLPIIKLNTEFAWKDPPLNPDVFTADEPNIYDILFMWIALIKVIENSDKFLLVIQVLYCFCYRQTILELSLPTAFVVSETSSDCEFASIQNHFNQGEKLQHRDKLTVKGIFWHWLERLSLSQPVLHNLTWWK